MAHITGGGLPENLPRCLNDQQSIQINLGSWPILPVFEWLAQHGSVSSSEMFNTFNMGIGYAVIVPPAESEQALRWFQSHDCAAYLIGEVIAGTGQLVGTPDAS
jgi:phosphoribosylformylglycinamidine cyclo-ligase